METNDTSGIIVLEDREHKWFWVFYVEGMTVVSHARHETQERAARNGAMMRERILRLADSADGGTSA